MELDEQFRQLADRVPAPPRGDASALYERGLRRRRWWQVGWATAALVIVGALGVGTAALIDRPGQVDIANQPSAPASSPADGDDGSTAPIDGPVITQPPALTVSSPEPFPWIVAFSAGDDDRWCVTAARGTTDMTDQTGQPCDHQLHIEQDVSWTASASNGVAGQELAWGTAPTDTEQVVVEFTDGTRRRARLASSDAVDATLWAIGYEQGDVQAVEAQGEGWASGSVALEDGWGVAEMLIVLGGMAAIIAVIAAAKWRITRRSA